jgi:hypothetical protein
MIMVRRSSQCGEAAHPAPGQDEDLLGGRGLQQVLALACGQGQQAQPAEPHREHEEADHHGGAHHAEYPGAFRADDVLDF